ncbi:DUF6531 domain-containing protein [Xanthomonas theicola]|uniref:DUF6531 domain-containing protein n=1 Tax=Xanthomonas theicola TaxID=56464 RepID=UPI00361D9FDE
MSLPGYTIGGAGSADGICTANSEPFLQSYCVDEAQMIQGILDFYHRISPDCTISSERIDGAYGEPFVRSMPHYGAGYLVFDAPGGKWFRFNLSCPGWSDPTPTPHDRLLVKRQIYSCPAGLYPFDAFNPVYNNTGNPDFVAEYPYLCQNGDTPMIYAKGIDQTKSCAANANPCLPATGDKFRREDDLTFAGKPFQRFYHSRQQLQSGLGMAPGWSHSFSDLLGYGGPT